MATWYRDQEKPIRFLSGSLYPSSDINGPWFFWIWINQFQIFWGLIWRHPPIFEAARCIFVSASEKGSLCSEFQSFIGSVSSRDEPIPFCPIHHCSIHQSSLHQKLSSSTKSASSINYITDLMSRSQFLIAWPKRLDHAIQMRALNPPTAVFGFGGLMLHAKWDLPSWR